MTQRGITLLEVMVALALLGLGMVVLIKSTAGNIFSTEDAHMMGIATDLARGKMYDIEEILLKDGFTDSDQSQESEKCFEDEGWPNICYSYKVEEPKLPSFDQLQAMGQKQAEDAAKAAKSGRGGEPAVQVRRQRGSVVMPDRTLRWGEPAWPRIRTCRRG